MKSTVMTRSTDVIQSGTNISDNDDPGNHSNEDEDYEEMLALRNGSRGSEG